MKDVLLSWAIPRVLKSGNEIIRHKINKTLMQNLDIHCNENIFGKCFLNVENVVTNI